jgi:hypothetical protein
MGRSVIPSMPFGNLIFKEKSKDIDVRLPHQYDSQVLFLMVVLAFIIWIAAYYRLKEKQV